MIINTALFFLLVFFCDTWADSSSQKVEKLKEALGMVSRRIVALNETVNNKEKVMMKKIEALQADNKVLRKKMKRRESDLKRLKMSVDEKWQATDLPQLMFCAFQKEWTKPSSTITFDHLMSDYKNSHTVNGGDGLMNTTSGVYTVVRPPGHYTATFSGRAALFPSQWTDIYLYHNGTRIEETLWLSWNSGTQQGILVDQGSRTVTVHLKINNTLEIRTGSYFSGRLLDFMFCLSLTGVNYNHKDFKKHIIPLTNETIDES